MWGVGWQKRSLPRFNQRTRTKLKMEMRVWEKKFAGYKKVFKKDTQSVRREVNRALWQGDRRGEFSSSINFSSY